MKSENLEMFEDNFNEDISLLTSEKVKSKKYSQIFHRIFPSGFKTELMLLLEIYVPVLFTNLFRFLTPIVSLMMCGHLSRLEFDAAALSTSLINVLGVSIDLGFSTAFDTLFAQIYGSDQKKKMGKLLQRAIIIMTLLYLILVSINMNIGPILIGLKQDPIITELTVIYLTYYLPGLYFDFLFLTISRYLQNQNIVYPMMISSCIGIIFCAISQYIGLFVLGYGIRVSATLQGISCFVMFLCQLIYVLASGVYKDTWDGWSLKACMKHWKIIFKLGIPGIFMIALEEWNFEIGTFVAGALSPVQLGAQIIVFQFCTILFMFSMSLAIAVSIRVGQYLGAGDIDRLKTSYRVGICIGATSASISCILIILLRSYIPLMFSNDKEIVEMAKYILKYISFFQFADVTVAVTSGIIKATGRQFIGAVTMFISYYIIGIPIGMILIFAIKTNIEGMWIGLIVAIILEALIFSGIIGTTDWNYQCKMAQLNTGAKGSDCDMEVDEYDPNSKLEVQSDHENEQFRPIIDASAPNGDIVNQNKHHIKHKRRRQRDRRRTCSMSDVGYYHSHYILSNPFLNNSTDISSDMSKSKENIQKLLIKRIITIFCVFFIFISALMLRLFLPSETYLPCLARDNITIAYLGLNSSKLCPPVLNITLNQ